MAPEELESTRTETDEEAVGGAGAGREDTTS